MLPLVELRWKTAEDQAASMGLLESAMQTLVQNVLSVVAVAALVHGGPRIQPRHAATTVDYFHRKCPLEPAGAPVQSGGSPFPASYFGAAEPMYSALNPSGGSSQTVDFNLGVARAEIAQTGGATGGARLPKAATAWVQHEMKVYNDHHRLTVSKGAKDQLTKLILRYITCLNHDLQHKQPLTAKKVRAVLKKKSYKVFH